MKKILLIVDGNPKNKIAINKSNSVRELKNTIRKLYPLNNYRINFYLNEKEETKIFDSDKYDNYDLSSIWKKLDQPVIKLTTLINLFTGNKDVDLLILKKLEDNDLFNACLTNKYLSNLCKDELFWKERFINRFGSLTEFRPAEKSWKTHYLKVIKDISNEDPFNYYPMTHFSYGYCLANR